MTRTHPQGPRPLAPTGIAALLMLALLALGFVLAASLGCLHTSLKSDLPPQPVTWALTDEGQRIYYYLLYETSRTQGDMETARQAIETLLAADGDLDVVYEAAAFYWRHGDLGRTRQILKQGLERFPNELHFALLLADTYLTEKRVDDAILTMQDFTRGNSDSQEAVRELAALLVQYERFQEALDLLEPLDPSQMSALLFYFKGEAYNGLGMTSKAMESLNEAVGLDPFMLEAWAELAYLQEMNKDYLAAEETYTKLLDLGEDRPEIWLRLVDINLQLNRPDKALSLVVHGPRTIPYLLQASSAFLDLKFYEQAQTVLDILAEQPHPPVEMYFHQAILAYEADKDPERAIELLKKVPPQHRYYDRSLRFRASMLYDLDHKEEALALIEEGKTLFPDDQSFFEMEAGFYEEEQDYDKAVALLNEALAKWPESESLLYNLGLILDDLDRKDEAIALMERILAQDPENADAMNFIGYTLTQLGQELDRALTLIRTALTLKPESGYIMDSLAWAHFKRGELQEAWEAITDALVKTESDPTIWEHYGDIAQALGKHTEASEGYAKALELDPEDSETLEAKLQSL